MSTCFIFINSPEDERFLSIRLNHQGISEFPLTLRTTDELSELTQNSHTFIILSAQHFVFHRLEFPWLTEKKARLALPYALEDKFTQPVDELHFAFDKHYYRQGHYFIAVCNKHYLEKILNYLSEKKIGFDQVTVDWFALKENEICLTEKDLLANTGSFAGALTGDLIELFLKSLSPEIPILTFSNSLPIQAANLMIHEEPIELWLAQRLLQIKPINLCQGSFQLSSKTLGRRRWFTATAIMATLCFTTMIADFLWQNHHLNQELKQVDAQIATIYHQFFPQAQTVISPRFRIEQLLKSSINAADNSFWILLNALSKELTPNLEINQLHFQNQTLQVTLASQDFESVETLQMRLRQAKIMVKQTQASTKDEKVLSSLELTL